eukprot:c12123_g1_i1.p1 GENE.c12123_g1_i1~~c12123_g1_i1.p1  ORF type:complete len:822 (+),score=176.81 c12123_g1_i1:39-2504(+)
MHGPSKIQVPLVNESCLKAQPSWGKQILKLTILLFVCLSVVAGVAVLLTRPRNLDRETDKYDSVRGPEVSIGAVGDFLFEDNLQLQAFSHGSYAVIWANITPAMKRHDMMYGNHEGTESFVTSVGNGTWDKICTRPRRRSQTRCRFGGNLTWTDTEIPNAPPVYEFGGVFSSGGPRLLFNYHPMLSTNLRDSGIGIMSTANNHCLDRGKQGLIETIDNLQAAGISVIGTRKTVNESYHVVKKIRGVVTAWVACTDLVNTQMHGRSDNSSQVLSCFDPEFLALITNLSKTSGIDAVIAAIHWGGTAPRDTPDFTGMSRGVVYQKEVDCMMRNFTRMVVDAGAAVVLGSHPHVLHRIDKYVSPSGRVGLIAYSLGNFVSHGGFRETLPPPAFLSRGYSSDLSLLYRRAAAFLSFVLARDPSSGMFAVRCLSYLPVSRKMLIHENGTKQFWVSEALPGTVEREFVMNVMQDSGKFATNITAMECHDFSAMVANQGSCSLPPPEQQPNSNGWVDEIPGQFCRCEKPDAVSGCQWCVLKTSSYCSGSPSVKKYLGSGIPYDECLQAVSKDPECGEFAYGGGGTGPCVCNRVGVPCDLEHSIFDSVVYRTTCPPVLPNVPVPQCSEVSDDAPCGYCQRSQNKYCRGGASEKKVLGLNLTRHVCLSVAQQDPECGHFVYGPPIGACTCLMRGKHCDEANSESGMSVFVDTCKAQPTLPECDAPTPTPTPSAQLPDASNTQNSQECSWCVAFRESRCGGRRSLKKDLVANTEYGMAECLTVAKNDPECGDFVFGGRDEANSRGVCRCVRKGVQCQPVPAAATTVFENSC